MVKIPLVCPLIVVCEEKRIQQRLVRSWKKSFPPPTTCPYAYGDDIRHSEAFRSYPDCPIFSMWFWKNVAGQRAEIEKKKKT